MRDLLESWTLAAFFAAKIVADCRVLIAEGSMLTADS
jgi:hypothetical protein